MNGRRVKVSVTISEDVLLAVDKYAESRSLTRSNAINLWLHRSALLATAQKNEKKTLSYYATLSRQERTEDKKWSHLSSKQFTKLDID